MFAKSNNVDGAYIQVNNGHHVGLVEIIIQVEDFIEIPEDIIHENGLLKIQLTDGDKPVKNPENYIVSLDVTTGAIKVVNK